jgi:hypothetical protein
MLQELWSQAQVCTARGEHCWLDRPLLPVSFAEVLNDEKLSLA